LRIPEGSTYTLYARTLIDGELYTTSIVIDGDYVKRLCIGTSCREGETIDLVKPGVVLIPGAIDMHVHLRGLKLSYKEDEESGTKAAAAGGVVLVVDMPNTAPRINSVEALKAKLHNLATRSYVDFGVYVGFTPRVDELRAMLSEGDVLGMKLYPEDLLRAMDSQIDAVARAGKLLIVHCEHPNLIRESCTAGKRALCRPIDAELRCIEEYHTRFSIARTHITHVTSPQLLMLARRKGFTTDTCPHYVLLSSEDEQRLGCLAKVNPPLRPRRIAEELLRLLAMGFVDAWTTDHAPHTLEEKSLPFEECPSGIVGLETSLHVLLTLLNKGVVTLGTVARMINKSPRSILGLRNYACTYKGCVASLTIVDLKREGVVDPAKFFSKAKLSPFQGLRYKGEPIATIVHGNFVYVEGEIVSKPIGKGVGAYVGKQPKN